MKKFNITFNPDAADAEVIDSIADIFEAADILEDSFQEGKTVWDNVAAALQAQPQIAEVVNDFPAFLDQIGKLPPSRVVASVVAARERAVNTRGQIGKIATIVGRGLLVLAGNYATAITTFQNAQGEVAKWQALLSGAPMFADELQGANQ